MSVRLLAILLLSVTASANDALTRQHGQGVFSGYSAIQDAADQCKGKRIGGVEFKGVSDLMGAYRYFTEQDIKLLGACYDSDLAETARKALLKWLKEGGHADAKVGVSVRPLPKHEDKEVIVTFEVAE